MPESQYHPSLPKACGRQRTVPYPYHEASSVLLRRQEIELSEADEVTGGGVGKWYYTYARFVKRTIDAAWRDGYRKAACPNCGAILALQNVVCYTDEELQMASQEKIKCHNCGTVNTGEAWATSTRK